MKIMIAFIAFAMSPTAFASCRNPAPSAPVGDSVKLAKQSNQSIPPRCSPVKRRVHKAHWENCAIFPLTWDRTTSWKSRKCNYTLYYTNALKRYKLLIVVTKFRVEIDHSAGSGFEPLNRHHNNSFKFNELNNLKPRVTSKTSANLVTAFFWFPMEVFQWACWLRIDKPPVFLAGKVSGITNKAWKVLLCNQREHPGSW